MDQKPPINFDDTQPDPMLENRNHGKDVSRPGSGRRFLSILIGFLVMIVILAVVAVAIYLLRDSMPEAIQEYIPENIGLPYVDQYM